jgi:hypothetical protein
MSEELIKRIEATVLDSVVKIDTKIVKAGKILCKP